MPSRPLRTQTGRPGSRPETRILTSRGRLSLVRLSVDNRLLRWGTGGDGDLAAAKDLSFEQVAGLDGLHDAPFVDLCGRYGENRFVQLGIELGPWRGVHLFQTQFAHRRCEILENEHESGRVERLGAFRERAGPLHVIHHRKKLVQDGGARLAPPAFLLSGYPLPVVIELRLQPLKLIQVSICEIFGCPLLLRGSPDLVDGRPVVGGRGLLETGIPFFPVQTDLGHPLAFLVAVHEVGFLSREPIWLPGEGRNEMPGPSTTRDQFRIWNWSRSNRPDRRASRSCGIRLICCPRPRLRTPRRPPTRPWAHRSVQLRPLPVRPAPRPVAPIAVDRAWPPLPATRW